VFHDFALPILSVQVPNTPVFSQAAQRLVHAIHNRPRTGGTTKGTTMKRLPQKAELGKFGEVRAANLLSF